MKCIAVETVQKAIGFDTCKCMRNGRVKWTPVIFALLTWPVTGLAQSNINFNRDVRPILSDRCFQCHGPNEHDRQADLRLDQADGPVGAYRESGGVQAIKPGSIEESAIWYRLTTEDDDAMPPPDSNKKPLSDAQKNVIKQWIEEGARVCRFLGVRRTANASPA